MPFMDLHTSCAQVFIYLIQLDVCYITEYYYNKIINIIYKISYLHEFIVSFYYFSHILVNGKHENILLSFT